MFNFRPNIFKIGAIAILLLSITALVADIFNLSVEYLHYTKIILVVSSATFAIYHFSKNEYDQSLTFVIISVLFNPIYSLNIQHHVWKILEFPVLLLYTHKIYLITYSDEIKKIENMAYLLDHYLKELERTITTLSFAQIAIYIRKRYPEQCKINHERICWHIDGLPDIEFEILYTFYALGRNSKGGVNAKFSNKYKNIEAHLNLNLSSPIKYSIKEGIGKNQPSRHAKQIKRVLVTKYHYLDL